MEEQQSAVAIKELEGTSRRILLLDRRNLSVNAEEAA